MAYHENIGEWHGKDLVDRNGERIGKLEDVYVGGDSHAANTRPRFPESDLPPGKALAPVCQAWAL